MNRILFIAYRITCLSLLIILGFSAKANEADSLISSLNKQSGEDKLNTLIALSDYYYKSSGRTAIKYGLMAVDEANALNNSNLLAKSYLSVRNGYNMLTIHDSSIYYLNKVLMIENIDKKYVAEAKSSMTETLYHFGKNDESIKSGEEAIKLYQELGDSASVADVYSLISNGYTKKGDFITSMNYAFKALKFYESKGDSLKMALTLMRIGTMYMIKRDRPGARPYYFRAYKIALNYPESMAYNSLLANLASYYRLTGNIDSSLIFHKMSLKADRLLGRKQDIAGTYLNMAHIYLKQDNYDTGYYYLNKSLSGFEELGSKGNMALVYSSMGMANFFQGNYDSSLLYINKSLEIAKEVNKTRTILSALELLPGIYEKKGEYKKSLNYYRKYIHFKDSIDGVKVKAKLAELETKYETAKKEQQILELEHEQEIQRSRELTLKAIIAAVVLVFIMIIIVIWQKRKKDRQIHYQNELFHKKEKELANAELEKSKLKEEELQQSILYKSKQLSTHALHMMQKNTMLQEIQSDIKVMAKKASDDDKQNYKRINLQINQSLRSHKDWDVFKLYFEDVNKNFYQKLKEINPELTTNDHRLCALIKLNMNSKEMASVLNVAPNSIKSSRYRLKKKLGLDVEADLEEYIRGLGK